ncbi:hypothetical protein PG996_002719 [Apiospora saccharicola]|uniref:F-box domain-containing protein n=1 Tax=Apiospora saccharicola TaxID=335842 RepID=A0ABR1WKA7_9PEZI
MRSTMPLLPAEVWCLIRGLLENDKRTLACLCQTCKSLQEFAEPTLYARYDIHIYPNDNGPQTRLFVAFYRTVLETPRLAALVTFLQVMIAIPAADEAGQSSEAEEEAARLLDQTVTDRFHFRYKLDLVVKRKWGVVPLAGLLPFLLPNLEHCNILEVLHYETFRLVRCLHRARRLPPLVALTRMFLMFSTYIPTGSCGMPDAFRLSSVAPLIELAPNLRELELAGCQGHEPDRRRPRIAIRREEGELISPLLPKFPASLQALEIRLSHFNAAELAHALSEYRSLRRFAYSEGGPDMFKPASIPNYHEITAGQVIEALRPVAHDTLERLELNLWRAPRLRDVGRPRLIRGNLGDAFPHLAEVRLSAEDLFWTLGPKPTTIEPTGGGGRLVSLLPEQTLCVLEFHEFDALVVPDLQRMAHAVAYEGRFPRLRTVRVNVAPEDPTTVTVHFRRLLPMLEVLSVEQRAVLEELFGRAGVEVLLKPNWMWGSRRDKRLP